MPELEPGINGSGRCTDFLDGSSDFANMKGRGYKEEMLAKRITHALDWEYRMGWGAVQTASTTSVAPNKTAVSTSSPATASAHDKDSSDFRGGYPIVDLDRYYVHHTVYRRVFLRCVADPTGSVRRVVGSGREYTLASNCSCMCGNPTLRGFATSAVPAEVSG
jgi:hypothetical protein